MEARKRLLPALFLAAGAALYVSLAPKWPKDQHLRLVLGDASPAVSEVTLRCAKSERGAPKGKVPSGDDWAREVTFHYAGGAAPRVVSYEPRLADGDYLVDIEVLTGDARVVSFERLVTLEGGTTSIELPQANALGRLP